LRFLLQHCVICLPSLLLFQSTVWLVSWLNNSSTIRIARRSPTSCHPFLQWRRDVIIACW
jgi:hypothetical protein